MKTLADLKRRLVVGQHLLCVENTYRPDLNGTRRIIIRVLTNQIVWTLPDSAKPEEQNWTRWPKASAFTFLDADTFRFTLDARTGDSVTLRFVAAPVDESTPTGTLTGGW